MSAGDMLQKLSRGAVIGDVAAPFSGDGQFAAGQPVFFTEQNLRAAGGSLRSGHHSGRAAANHNTVIRCCQQMSILRGAAIAD